MKRCAKCGRAYSDLVTTCSYCGCSLSGNAGANPAPKPPVQQAYTPPVKPTTPPVQPAQPVTPPARPAAPVQPSPTPVKPSATSTSENVGKGFLGALLFAIAGGVIQGILINVGMLAAAAGIITFLLAQYGYQKFSGVGDMPPKKSYWVCIPVSLLMLVLGTVLGSAVYAANIWGVSVSEALSIMQENSELMEAVGSDLFTTLALWAASVVISLIRGRKKK